MTNKQIQTTKDIYRIIMANKDQDLLVAAKQIVEAGYVKEEEIRKETASNILKELYNLCKERNAITWDDMFYLVIKYKIKEEIVGK